MLCIHGSHIEGEPVSYMTVPGMMSLTSLDLGRLPRKVYEQKNASPTEIPSMKLLRTLPSYLHNQLVSRSYCVESRCFAYIKSNYRI